MSLFRLLVLAFLFYLGYKLFINVLRMLNSDKPKTRVHGTGKDNSPLDLSNQDVEDADFEDID